MHPGKRVDLVMLIYGKSWLRCKRQQGKVVFTDSQFARCLALNETPAILVINETNSIFKNNLIISVCISVAEVVYGLIVRKKSKFAY